MGVGVVTIAPFLVTDLVNFHLAFLLVSCRFCRLYLILWFCQCRRFFVDFFTWSISSIFVEFFNFTEFCQFCQFCDFFNFTDLVHLTISQFGIFIFKTKKSLFCLLRLYLKQCRYFRCHPTPYRIRQWVLVRRRIALRPSRFHRGRRRRPLAASTRRSLLGPPGGGGNAGAKRRQRQR